MHKQLLRNFAFVIIAVISISSLLNATHNVNASTQMKPCMILNRPIDVKTPESKESNKSANGTSLSTSGKTYYTTSSLNMRKGSSAQHAVITVIPKGRPVSFHLSSGKWFKVTYNGKTGYVSSNFLSTSKPKQQAYKANSMYIMGRTLPYKNGGKEKGQSIIDNNIGTISTWGGAPTWSGKDGLNTHFIGHSHGAFKGLWNVAMGSKIIVTDKQGNPTTYKVTDKFVVDDYGRKGDKSYHSYIVDAAGGEVISLQTCETESTNWIIRAEKI